MSWLDKITTDLVIETGDGQKYKPLWLNAGKQIEYNVAEFEFPEVSGTLVRRKRPKGARYSLEIYFQGADHLDTARAFELSAADPRAWKLTHPYYGRLIVQPLSLSLDNGGHNITKITCPVVETITEEYPKGTDNPKDKIANDVTAANSAASDAYANNAKPTAANITQQQNNVALAYNNAIKYAPQDLGEELFNNYNKSLAALTTLDTAAKVAIGDMQDVIGYPAKYQIAVAERLRILKTTFTNFRVSLPQNTTKNQKLAYEANNYTSVTAMLLSASTPVATDYATRTDVLNIVETLIADYNTYLNDLDSLQSLNGGSPDSYIPDAQALTLLNNLFNYTLSSLFGIASNAKQQRNIVLTENSNWVQLAHMLYGLTEDDSTITLLMQQNNAGLNTILQVPANTRVFYYV